MVSASIPLPLILEILDQPKPSNVQHVLKSLYLSPETISTASKSDLNHFVSKTINLLNARDDYKRWYGAHVVQVIAMNPVVLTTGGTNLITALLKLVHDSTTVSVNFSNSVRALDAVMKGIRGKPVLTREILTPQLPQIISALLENLERDFSTVLPVLEKLLMKNTTTFKPFAKKFEAKLAKLLVSNFNGLDKKLQKRVCRCYAYLHLIKPNQAQAPSGSPQPLPDDQWRLKLLQLMDELRSVTLVYDNIVDLKAERDTMALIKQLPDLEKKEYIFPFLQIDLGQPLTLISISDRIGVLVQLIVAFVTSATPFPLRIPLGLLVQLANLLMGLSPNYIPLKAALKRDAELKRMVLNDMVKTQGHGVTLVTNLVGTYKKLTLPHLSSILSSLEVIVPVKSDGKKKVSKVDSECALNIEDELLSVIRTATQLLQLFQGLTELELIEKLVDVSLLLLEVRTPLDGLLDKQPVVTNVNVNKQKNKKKKSKDATPMADLLSHAELFEIDPAECTVNTVHEFFLVLIKKVPQLSATHRIKMTKYIIGSGVKQNVREGCVSAKTALLLEALVLFPGKGEIYAVLPIAKRLLPNNEKLSLLTCPRFPLLDVKYRASAPVEAIEENEEDEDEAMGDDEGFKEPVKDDFQVQTVTIAHQPSVFKSTEELQTMSFPESEPKHPLDSEDDTPSKRLKVSEMKVSETVTVGQAEAGEDSESDFEIPEIELSDDE